MVLALMGMSHAEEDDSVVRFTNGDQLTGRLMSMAADRLVWKSVILKEPWEFELAHVLELGMPAKMGVEAAPEGEHEVVLEMRNKDTIKGRLVGLTDDEITLDTWYAGKLVVRRVNVNEVKINRTSEILYRGPTSLEGWHTDEGERGWEFKAGGLQSKGATGISREIDFTDECKVAFDASWRGGFRPRLVIFSEDAEAENPQGGFELVFQANTVHVKRGGANAWLGHSTNAGILREQESARIEIRASLKSGKILMYVDGRLIEMWEDADVKSLKSGKGFHIIAQDNNPMRISNIVVSEWDGYVDEVPRRRNDFRIQRFQGDFQMEMEPEEEEEVKPEPEEGRMILVNGDSIQGEVLGIEGEMIKVKTSLSEVSFPVHRLKNIVLKKADMEDAKLYKGDVRATLSDGTRLVFRLDAVKDGKLVGFSQQFGTAEFSQDAFRRIEFNIHTTKLDDLRKKDGW